MHCAVTYLFSGFSYSMNHTYLVEYYKEEKEQPKPCDCGLGGQFELVVLSSAYKKNKNYQV